MPAKITVELTLDQANTLVKGMHWLRRHFHAVDDAIHATDEERRIAARDWDNATEILNQLGALDSDPAGQT